MFTKTNLAIIGYGYMGGIYKKACLELYDQKNIETYYKYDFPGMVKGFRLKAVVDIKFSESWFSEEDEIWFFNNIDQMLRQLDLSINTAVISTPIRTHFDIAKKLISNNISLLIEKPVCETAKEVKELIALSKKYQVRIMPGHVERYNPVTLDAAEAVKYRMYGKVVNYNFLRASSKPERVSDSLIIDKLIHDLDLVQCIFGKYKIADIKINKVQGEIMECTVFTTHKKGYQGEIVSSWLSLEKTRKVIINFERGSMDGDLIEKKIEVNRYMELSKQISGYRNNQIKDQLVDFIAFKNKLIKTLVNMKDALQAAYSIDEINRKIENEI